MFTLSTVCFFPKGIFWRGLYSSLIGGVASVQVVRHWWTASPLIGPVKTAETGNPRSRARINSTTADCFTQTPSTRDGNGDPIPDSPRGIPPLGDGDGTNLIPAGI
jgi:hypothetical protein